MRQLTKEVYEAPLTTKRVVTMESSCMAASGEEMTKENSINIKSTNQEVGFEIDLDGDWEQGQ